MHTMSNIGDFVRAKYGRTSRQGVLMTIREDCCIIDTAFGECVVSPDGMETIPYESQSDAVRQFVERCRARTPYLDKN